MALVGLVKKHDPIGEAVYLFYIETLVTWCCHSRLDMTVAETKKLNKTLKWSNPYSMAHLLKPLQILNTQVSFCSMRTEKNILGNALRNSVFQENAVFLGPANCRVCVQSVF